MITYLYKWSYVYVILYILFSQHPLLTFQDNTYMTITFQNKHNQFYYIYNTHNPTLDKLYIYENIKILIYITNTSTI